MARPESRDPPTLVAVTGMVASGKTTLARALAAHLGWGMIGEDVGADSNPWLARFYASEEERRRNALPLQLHFLLDRVEALQRIQRKGGEWVADQTLDVDFRVFVSGHRESGLLDPDEFRLLERAHWVCMQPGLPEVDLLVCLHAPLPLVLERIRARARPRERDVPLEYWETLHRRYTQYMEMYPGPSLDISANGYDLLARPDGIEDIASAVSAALR